MKIEELKASLKETDRRIVDNRAALAEVRDRLEGCRSRVPEIREAVERLRKERQSLLAEGKDPGALNKALRERREAEELIDDEIAGLTEKLAALETEEEELSRRQPDITLQIMKEEVIRPLVVRYNKAARQMAETLKALEEARLDIGLLARRAGYAGDIVSVTRAPGLAIGWENSSLSDIPSLHITGESDPGRFYDRRTFLHDLARRRREESERGEESPAAANG